MISPTVNFLQFLKNEGTFHSKIDDQAAREKLIRYATAFCTERTYNTYLIHQSDSSKDYATLKIYNAVEKQFENHLMTYNPTSNHISLKTLGKEVRVFSSISEIIKELDQPLLKQLERTQFLGSVLIGVHHQCLSLVNARSETLIASARPGEPIDALIVEEPDAVIAGKPSAPITIASTSSTSSSSSTAAHAGPAHIASAGIATFVDERAEMQEKIRDSELCASQKIVMSDPHYTLKTKEELEAEWTKTPNNIHYAFRNGTKPRIFILSFSIPHEPIRHCEFEATEIGLKLSATKTVFTLRDVVSSFLISASL